MRYPSAVVLAVMVAAASVQAQEGRLRLRVIDAQSRQPAPARVHLLDPAGKPVRTSAVPFWHDHFVCNGSADLTLAPGRYHYQVERGPEYSPATGHFDLPANDPLTIEIPLRRLIDLAPEGWWSGELHVHRKMADIELLMRAEDLHVAPVITWWNNTNLWKEGPPSSPLLRRFDGDRFYRVMGGEDEREGGALLYFHLDAPLDIIGSSREYPSPMKFLAQADDRGAWIDIEKPFWWDVPVWLASGKVDSIGIANNHMNRSGMHPNEAWGRPRDETRLPPPLGNGFWTQEIYYHILNTGLRLPPSAGSASGVLPNPVGYNRVYVQVEGELSWEKWWEGLRAGRCFVTNGPLPRCKANGQLPGHRFTAESGRSLEIDLAMQLDSHDPVAMIQIIRDGRIERQVSYEQWQRSGSLGKIRFENSGWFLIRVLADHEKTFRFASTAPWYVQVGDQPRVSRASVQFFLDWLAERRDRVKLADPSQLQEVLSHHDAARAFWQERLSRANAP